MSHGIEPGKRLGGSSRTSAGREPVVIASGEPADMQRRRLVATRDCERGAIHVSGEECSHAHGGGTKLKDPHIKKADLTTSSC